MKAIGQLLILMIFWYLVFLIPCSNFNPFEWGIFAKVFYVIMIIASSGAFEDDEKE